MDEETTRHSENIRELMRRKLDLEEYRLIRREWIAHSIAEDSRSIPGLLATLTEDCVYELIQTGHRWKGHDGAAAFYTELLTAFPDIHFDLQNIVIGPQGVYEEAFVTGTHEGPWLGVSGSGKAVTFTVIIYFPWDPEKKKFKGERVMSTLLPEHLQ